MDVKSILNEYDKMFGRESLDDIENFLYGKISQAITEGETGVIITLLNEMIGLCRDTSQKEKALAYSGQLIKLLDNLELQGTQSYATSMQNVANAYRAFGLWKEALGVFEIIEKTYQLYLEENHVLWPTLYNNWGLLYQEMGDYEQSVRMLKKSLERIAFMQSEKIKHAITMSNLGTSLISLGNAERAEEGCDYLNKAILIFQEDGERDFHYGAALVAMGDYMVYKKQWHEAKEYYKKGLVEILLHTWKNDSYGRVYEKYMTVAETCKENSVWKNNLQRSKEFYENYGRKMIKEEFPEYENRIAVGMVGEGSDCFGFDDEISMDHDYEPGFCMWLTKEDYETIGSRLQKAYDKIVKDVMENEHHNPFLQSRRGVFTTEEFYQNITDDCQHAEKINGEVFRDDLGDFSERRKQLTEYYPEPIRRQKLANLVHEFSQYGQSNYSRMMARKDYVTASICIAKTMECAMDIAYVLNKRYSPYYKWKKKGMENSGFMPELVWICDILVQVPLQKKAWEQNSYDAYNINTDDRCVMLIELMARVIQKEMKEQGLIQGEDLFMESYVEQLIRYEKK